MASVWAVPKVRRQAGVGRAVREAAAGVVFIALAYIQIVQWPATAPWPRADSVDFLVNGERLLRGGVLYREVFDLTYPGAIAYYAGWMKLFGVSAWIPALTMVGLGAAAAWMTMKIAGRVASQSSALPAGLATMVFAVYYAPDATHRWFSTVAVLAATWVALRETRRSLQAAAALCGVATFFTQTSVLALAALIAWHRWKQERSHARDLWLATAVYTATVVSLCGYFVARAGLRAFWWATVTFVVKYYQGPLFNSWRMYGLPLPGRSVSALPDLAAFAFLHLLLPLIYVLFAVRYARAGNRVDERWRALMLVEFMGVALFVSVAGSASSTRLAMVAMPGVVLLAWLMEQPGAAEKMVKEACWTAVIVLAVTAPVIRQTRWHGTLQLPIGRVAVTSPEMYADARWLGDRSRRGEYSFGHPPLEFALGLRQAAPVLAAVSDGYTPPDQMEETIRALDAHQVPIVLLNAMSYVPQRHDTSSMQPLLAYVQAHYTLSKMLGGTEVWVRNGASLPK